MRWISLLLFCVQLFAAEPLKVGMELTYPPFEMIDSSGDPSGISVDLAYALGDSLNREIDIENIPFLGLIPSLQAEKIDLILSSMSATPERRRAIAFSNPYLKMGLCLLISAKSDLGGILDANRKGRIICVKQATTGETWALTHLKQAKVVVLDQESSCILEVVQGKADAFIYDQISVYQAQKKYPTDTRMNLTPFHNEEWAIGLRKQDKKLLKQINAFLGRFKKNGGFDALSDKYLKEQKQAFQEMGIPLVF